MSTILFDIETLAYPDEVILANVPEWSEEEARTRVPRSYKKPEAIAGWVEDDKANHTKNILEKAALNAEIATIAVAGFYRDKKVFQFSAESSSEKAILLAIMNQIDQTSVRVLGWNILGFDLPFFLKRCWINDVKVPKDVFMPLSRYPINERFTDMMKVWQAGNFKAPFTSLNNAMKAVGMPGKPDGSEFAKMWAEDRGKALKYSEDELLGQAALYRKMGVDL